MWSHPSGFPFNAWPFGVPFTNHCQDPSREGFTILLGFLVSGVMFKFVIHCELLIFVGDIRFQFHYFTCRYPVFLPAFVKKYILPPLWIFGNLVKDQLTEQAWVYFWVLCPVLLVYLPVFMLALYCFNCHSFVTYFVIRKCDTSNYVLLSQ